MSDSLVGPVLEHDSVSLLIEVKLLPRSTAFSLLPKWKWIIMLRGCYRGIWQALFLGHPCFSFGGCVYVIFFAFMSEYSLVYGASKIAATASAGKVELVRC
ncbi:unnamed protein product [Eruca vesicaria subsp. sativa]|uniref:Uncharacterized protein n=1 Tax=Eruca vesicaria subsp. sativa TaxID=29727 RepID=A0ABC8KDR2_ERUVS|nr:unnamed protein product [Eruca vesicaria subsp. sativa]